MAKKDKAAKPDTKGKSKSSKDEDEATPEFKYGVQDIADKLGIAPASVRVQLRNKGIEKAGKSYGWNSKSELAEVIDQLKTKTSDDDDKPKKSKKSSKEEKPSKKDKKAGKNKPSKKSKDEDEDDDDD